MRIGLLYSGDDHARIHGSAITTYYLGEAFERLGHEVWRWSVTSSLPMPSGLVSGTDMVIAEGVPHEDIAPTIWRNCACVMLWHLSKRFYNAEALVDTPFHAVATNSREVWKQLAGKAMPCAYIELAAPSSFAQAVPQERYRSIAVYLGIYPHKSEEQLSLMLRPAALFDLAIWGHGWQGSPFAAHHRGILPLCDIGSLYRSVDAVLALTEERQKVLGMINNRIYEALATAAVVISDDHPALASHELGEFINCVKSEAEVLEYLRAGRQGGDLKTRAERGQRAVLAGHTYRERVQQFLALFRECH